MDETPAAADDERVRVLEQLYELPETPDEIELAPGQRVVAIGDIHGKYALLKLCLQAANLIGDDDDEWCGGNTILVQVGDLLDRGHAESDVFKLLAKIGREAKKEGGAVIVLWGNHEVDNVCGDFAGTNFYKSPWTEALGPVLECLHGANWKRIAEKSSEYDDRDPAREMVFRRGGLLAKPFLSKLKVMVKVGKSVFVHAGFVADQIAAFGGIAAMNNKARSWVLNETDCPPNDILRDVPFFDQTQRFCPIFMRTYSHPSNASIPSLYNGTMRVSLSPEQLVERAIQVDQALHAVRADRMIVGHTVQDSINPFLGGKVWRIDLGNGLPREYRLAPAIEDPSVYRYEALEIANKNGEEVVAVLRRIRQSYEKNDFKNT